MSSVNTLFSGNFYQLNSQEKSSTSGTGNALEQLVSSVKQATTSDQSEKAATDLLDLTAEAQAYLERTQATADKSEELDKVTPFILSRKDQATLNSIINKYKDAPFTQESFQQMQQELKSANVSSEQLAAKEKMRTLSPARMFIDIMAGKEITPVVSLADDKSFQAKGERYMRDVITRWSEISTTIDDDGGELEA